MASLSNNKIKDTYQSLVKFNDNGNITTSAKRLTDGFGNNSPFFVSTTQIGIGVTPTLGYDLHVNSNAKIGGNLLVSGNLTVSGTLTYLDVEDLATEDPLIKLARNNVGNSLDIGFFGKYVESTVTKYKGLFNDADDNKWKLFIGTSDEPTTIVNTSGTGYTVGTLVANLEGNVTGTVSSLSNHDTDDLSEGSTNLYFTTARARASFTQGTGVTITNGEIAIGQDVGTTSNVTFGKIIAGSHGGTSGSILLQQKYSGNDIISTIGTMYSSGGLLLGYAVAPKNGASGFISTADNASFARAYMLLDNDEFTIGYAAGQNTAVGSDITGLTTPFTLNITNGNATFTGSVTATAFTGNAYLNTIAYQGGEGTELDNSAYNADGIGTTFRWIENNSSTTGTTWKKVADVVLNDVGFKSGVQMEVKVLQPNTYWGDNASLNTIYYSIAFRGDESDTGPFYDDALVYGPDANLIRVYKTSTHNYELQARSNDNNEDLVVECNITSKNGAKVTPTTTYTDGTITGGTAYTASPNNLNVTKFAGNVEFEGAVFDDAEVEDLRVNEYLYLGSGATSGYGPHIQHSDSGGTGKGMRITVDSDLQVWGVTGNAGEQNQGLYVAGGVAKLYDMNGVVLETVLGGVDITGDLDVSGTITGDVTGDLTGNVTGNVTGDLTGSVTGAASLNVLKAGDTMTGDLILNDDVKLELGTDSDLQIYHDGSDAYIDNINGALSIRNYGDDKSIIFKTDNGIGGITEYFKIDGNINRNVITATTQIGDNTAFVFGAGAGRPYIKYDTTASQLFISGDSKFLSDAYVVNNLNVQKSIYQTASGGFYINKPYGADFYTTTNEYTGAIEIALPTGGTGHDDMIKFVVDIFDYRTQESVTVFVGGYTYQNVGSGNTTWYYVSATVLGQSANQNYTVRFGDNGTEHCVWIGDTDSTWNHLQVIVRDFFAGYGADINNYLGAWDINVVTTQTTVNNTLTNCFPMSSDTITGYLPLTGGTLTGALAGTSATFAGNVTLSSTGPLLYLANTTSTTGKTWRFSSAANGKFFITQEGVIDAVTLDHTTGNATFSGSLTSASLSAASIGISGSNGTDGKGISLYGGAHSGQPTYGIMFMGTGTYGTMGYVSGSWATYFTMDDSSNRGWIFRNVTTGNVASINNDGKATFGTPSKFYTNDSELIIQDAGTNAVQIVTGAGDELYIGGNNSYQFHGTTTGQARLNSVAYVRVTAGASNYTGLSMYQTDGSLVGYLYGDSGQTSNPGIGILDSDGNWAVRVRRDISVDLRVNDVQRFNVTTGINYNYQPTWIEGGSADWNETIPGLSTGSLHLVPSSTDNFGSAITFGASDRVSGTNAQAGIYTRTDGTYGTKMYFATTGSYSNGSSTRMMIDYNGNIGINQTSPLQKLEIQTGTDTDGIIITGDGTSMSTGQYRKIGFQYSNTDASYASEIRFTVPVGGVHGGAIAFNTHQSGSATMTERGRFNQYGQLLINATSSGYGSNLYGYNLGVRGNSSQAFISIARNTQTLDTQGMIVGVDSNTGYLIMRDNLPLDFYNNNTFKMRLNTSGQLGIGENSPAQKLQVAGNIRVGDVAGSGRPYIDFVRIGGAVVGGIGWHTNDVFYVGAHPAAGPTAGNSVKVYGFGNELRLGCTSYGDMMFLQEAGGKAQVGIGGSPSSSAGVHNFLSIKGSSHAGIMLQDTDGGAVHETWNDGGTLNMWDSSIGYRMRFYTSGDAQIYNGLRADAIGVSGSNGTDGKGISLYNGASSGEPTYGMMFMQTATFGTYGSVSGDWATYFTMNNNASRGWIFRRVGNANYASISGAGDLSLSGIVNFPTTNMRLLGTSSSYLRIKSGSASDSGIELQNTSGTVLGYFYGNTSQMGMYNKEGYNLFKATPGAGGVTTIYKGNGITKIEAGDNVNIYHNTGTTTFNSNGYVQTQSWIYIGSGAGIYSATNGAHFYPNNSGSYATWKIIGSKGGYTGIRMDYGNGVNVGMYDSGGNGGNWQATAGWHFYYHQGNGCLAVGSSTTSSSYSLYVTGSIYSTADVIAYSDKRAKENIVTVDSAIEKVNKLRGVYYTPKEGEDKSRKVGVIAQEILQVLPEVVTYDNDNDRYGVDYGKITGLLIEAIKDQQKQIDKLTKFVDKLNK